MKRRETSGFKEAVYVYKEDFLNFRGYASPSEFWWGILYLLLVNIAIVIVYTIVTSILTSISYALFIVPMIAVIIALIITTCSGVAATYRRYRDVGLTGFSTSLLFIIMIGLFVSTTDFYYYTDMTGNVSVGFQNNNIIYIVLCLLSIVIYFLPYGVFATKNKNKFLGLFLETKAS